MSSMNVSTTNSSNVNSGYKSTSAAKTTSTSQSTTTTNSTTTTSTSSNVDHDEYVGSVENPDPKTYKKPEHKVDQETIDKLNAGLKNNTAAFQQMVQDMFKAQNKNADFMGIDLSSSDGILKLKAAIENGDLKVDAATAEKAAAAIGEDGEWGVEAVSERLVEFAKAQANGDMSKYDDLLEGIKNGFSAAGKDWGKDMPSITKQTYDRTMEKMEAWKNEATKASEGVSN